MGWDDETLLRQGGKSVLNILSMISRTTLGHNQVPNMKIIVPSFINVNDCQALLRGVILELSQLCYIELC